MADQQMMEQEAPQAPVADDETGTKKGRLRRKERAPKPPKARKEKPARSGLAANSSLFSLSDDGPTREELERQAAEELMTAIAPSLDLLRVTEPDASSPAEAQRKIESKLGPPVSDRDAGVPNHPIYSGDALVYYQLRRHYGAPHAGGSFARGWDPPGQ